MMKIINEFFISVITFSFLNRFQFSKSQFVPFFILHQITAENQKILKIRTVRLNVYKNNHRTINNYL